MRYALALLALSCVAGDAPAAGKKADKAKEYVKKHDLDLGPDVLLVARLPDKPFFQPGEEIRVETTYKNVSGPEKLTLWESGMNVKYIVRDARGKECALTEEGRRIRALFDPHGKLGRNYNHRIILKRGESRTEGVLLDLASLFKLGVGRYTAVVIYHEDVRPTSAYLESEPVPFEIRYVPKAR
jgi:hypothetical protein